MASDMEVYDGAIGIDLGTFNDLGKPVWPKKVLAELWA